MEVISAKTILTKTKCKEEWFGFDFTVNLYKGCSHGCIYCDSRSQCYRIKDFDTVKVKANAIEILNSELRNKKRKGIVGMGSMSDPYNPLEKEFNLSRQALKLFDYYGFGVGITTKSDLVLKDLDLLQRIHQKKCAVVNVTITTADDACASKIEPHVCVSSKRFQIVQACKEAGLISGIIMNPVLPFITDSKENMMMMIEQAQKCHADYILTYMGVTLRENQRDYYYKKLDELYPNLSYKYQTTYQNRYHCETLKWRENYELLKNECEKRGILYRMDDIVKLITSSHTKISQPSLFE